jgi:hypothetical protein
MAVCTSFVEEFSSSYAVHMSFSEFMQAAAKSTNLSL